MILLSTTLVGLGIGFGSVMGLSDEAAQSVLFVITMTASFYGFSAWLEERSNSVDISRASLADYRGVPHV